MKRTITTMLMAAGICLTASAQIKTPLMGWSSWNTYGVNISDTLIMRQADAMVKSGLKDAGYQYINIDDGYFGGRDDNGNLQLNKARFPGSMRAVSDYIHSLGLKAGIYTDAGASTCASIWGGDKGGFGSAIYGHEEQDSKLFFKDWNFDFIKIDYCGADNLNLEESKRYTEIVNTFRRLGFGNVSVNICRWAFPGVWAKNVADSWRISGDINASWKSVKYIIDKNLYLSAYASDGHYNDMDMLEVGRGMSQVEDETHFGMWCMMSSPLLVGCDMTKIPAAALKLMTNKELLAINQDPLGLQAYVVQHDHDGYVLVKDILQRRGLTRAVALYNPTDSTLHFSVPTETLELAGKVKVRDLVLQKNLPAVKNALVYDVPAHATKILRVQAEQRIEPYKYEAEWAYLPLFNDLAKRPKAIQYAPMQGASGEMKVINIGGSKENYAEWNNVYSDNGGNYDMTISYIPKKLSHIELTINGKAPINVNTQTTGDDIVTVTVPVVLEKGNNDIRIGSTISWSPDIDCFTLTKK